MAFRMKGFSPFTKEKNIEGTKHDKGGVGNINKYKYGMAISRIL